MVRLENSCKSQRQSDGSGQDQEEVQWGIADENIREDQTMLKDTFGGGGQRTED